MTTRPVLRAVGVDVAKRTLDVAIAWNGKLPVKHVSNSPAGFEQMERWWQSLGSGPVWVVLEATGTYSDAVARYLHERGHQVSVINPARLAAFRKSEGVVTKTDKQDAKLLVRYAQQKQPQEWTPAPEVFEQLQVLELRREQVLQMRQQERNHLENSRLDAQTHQQITSHIEQLDTLVAELQSRAEALVAQQEQLATSCALLDSIPGIASLTARRVMAVLVEVARFEGASQLVAYAGIASAEVSSGTSVRGSGAIHKNGHIWLRKWLYMPALRVMTADADFAQWVAELRARGKPNMVIVVAVMRKLLHIIYGVLASGQPYDAHKAFPTHYATSVTGQGQPAGSGQAGLP
jgi:transposase